MENLKKAYLNPDENWIENMILSNFDDNMGEFAMK